jgi:hypothetical protein
LSKAAQQLPGFVVLCYAVLNIVPGDINIGQPREEGEKEEKEGKEEEEEEEEEQEEE